MQAVALLFASVTLAQDPTVVAPVAKESGDLKQPRPKPGLPGLTPVKKAAEQARTGEQVKYTQCAQHAARRAPRAARRVPRAHDAQLPPASAHPLEHRHAVPACARTGSGMPSRAPSAQRPRERTSSPSRARCDHHV